MDGLNGWEGAGLGFAALTIALSVMLLVVQPLTRASVSVSCIVASIGLSGLTGVPLYNEVDPDDPAWYERAHAVFDMMNLLASASYILALVQTAQPSARDRLRIRILATAGCVLAGLVFVVGVLFPAERLNDFFVSSADDGFLTSTGFLIFAPLFSVVVLVFGTAWILVARQRLDVGERVRARNAFLVVVTLAVTIVLPPNGAAAMLGVIVLIGLYGQLRYFVAQGERSAFLSRFLSPEVDESVRFDGLNSVMQPGERRVTVVACDLRGFTAYAQAVPSQAVIDLLNEYYQAVGQAATEVHGTIKDYAGDGVLMLIGAPIAQEDHAQAGLRLARRLHEVIAPVLEHWSTEPHPLGLGVGVASGRVTVGAVGSSSRLEYTAVGTAVNVAARLCSAAAAGECLVSDSTVALTGVDGLEARRPMPVKGLSADQTVYAL